MVLDQVQVDSWPVWRDEMRAAAEAMETAATKLRTLVVDELRDHAEAAALGAMRGLDQRLVQDAATLRDVADAVTAAVGHATDTYLKPSHVLAREQYDALDADVQAAMPAREKWETLTPEDRDSLLGMEAARRAAEADAAAQAEAARLQAEENRRAAEEEAARVSAEHDALAPTFGDALPDRETWTRMPAEVRAAALNAIAAQPTPVEPTEVEPPPEA